MLRTLKRLVVAMCLVCSLASIQAQSNVELTGGVAIETAKQVADNFMSLNSDWAGATEADVRLVEQEGVPVYYVVEYKQGGWAIVSAQSSSSPIIGYNTTGRFATPEPMKDLLDFNAKIIKTRATAEGEIEHVGWKQVKQRRAAAAQINTTPDIEPLITINLDQSYPFNTYCPTIDGQNTIVGCVAVGMAQAMMVQGYPAKPEGKYSYQCANTGWHYLNYDDEPAYDWEAMYACESTGNYEEVARLLYHCGVSVEMKYGLNASGAQSRIIADALVRNFGYNPNTIRYTVKLPDDAAWLDLLLDELEKGRVVIYHGQSDRGGHCWNIDGWNQATQMVHCNWGWLGYGNGYFSLDNLTDSYQGLSFLNHQGAILGVVAPTNAPYDILLDKTHFIEGTEAGVALANVQVMSEDNNATYTYEVSGVDGTTNIPYRVVDGQIVSTETITDDSVFKSLHIKAINDATKESYEKDFDIQVVSDEVYNLVGKYKASAYSAASNGSLIEWQISITVDKEDPRKVWLEPVILFAGLDPETITPVYAIYDEEENTLSMPLGQVVYDTYYNKLVISTTVDANSYNLTDNVIMQVSYDSGVEIEYADEYFLCVTDILSEPFALYEGIYGVTLEKKSSVISDLSYLEGTYRATAYSAFPDRDDELWSVNMTVDKDEPGKVWIQPICMFGLSAEYIAPVYAIYEDDNTLLMPLGQIVYEDDSYKFLIGKSDDGSTVDVNSSIPLNITQSNEGVDIAFAQNFFFGVGDVRSEGGWWYQAIHNVAFSKPHVVNTAPYDIELSRTSFVYGSAAGAALADVVVSCDDWEAVYSYELFARNNEPSPYQIIDGTLVSTQTIDNSDLFEYLRIKVTNTRTGESYEEEFDITIKEVDLSYLEGTYGATAHSAFEGYEDESWSVSITVDEDNPGKVWIQPICMFGGLSAEDITPVYAIYEDDNTLLMPLGQVVYEDNAHNIITAKSDDGSTIDIDSTIPLHISQTGIGVEIAFAQDFVFGLGDNYNGVWWYQAIYNIYFTADFADDVVIYDDTPSYEVKAEITCSNLSYIRNFENTEWQTWYVPFDVDYSLLAANFAVAQINNVHQYDENKDGVIELTTIEAINVTSGVLKANYPYLIKANTAVEYTLLLENVTLYPALVNSIDCSSVSHRFVCTGTYNTLSAEMLSNSNCYTLSDEYFTMGATEDLGAFRWYMFVENRGTQPTPERVMLRVDNSYTDIEDVVQEEGEAEYYDLSGRRVEYPTEGIYIMKQGDVVKKVVVNRR